MRLDKVDKDVSIQIFHNQFVNSNSTPFYRLIPSRPLSSLRSKIDSIPSFWIQFQNDEEEEIKVVLSVISTKIYIYLFVMMKDSNNRRRSISIFHWRNSVID